LFRLLNRLLLHMLPGRTLNIAWVFWSVVWLFPTTRAERVGRSFHLPCHRYLRRCAIRFSVQSGKFGLPPPMSGLWPLKVWPKLDFVSSYPDTRLVRSAMQPPFSHTRWDRQRPIWTSLNTSCNSGLTLTYPFISYRTQTQADLPH